MTEDDTFRRLKRIPYLDMLDIHLKWLDRTWAVTTSQVRWIAERDNLFLKYSWTYEEFDKERQKILDEIEKE